MDGNFIKMTSVIYWSFAAVAKCKTSKILFTFHHHHHLPTVLLRTEILSLKENFVVDKGFVAAAL